ncbi:MAG: hypothetical protein WAZ77_04125 [Candidatus Nitrosopolaris sp.]
MSGIRKRRYFNQLRCHLKDEKYREIENIISDIEKSEPEHNEKVAYLMNNMRGNIRTTILEAGNGNGALQTSREILSLREYDKADPNYEPHFVLDEIIRYIIDKSIGKSTMISIRRLNGKFQLVREGNFMISAGKGDERIMKWVLNKIGSLNVITDLEKLRAEAIRINELFNIKLKSKINDLVIDIEEERFAGKCDSKYHEYSFVPNPNLSSRLFVFVSFLYQSVPLVMT